jgi:hypothetical protein
MGSTHIRAKLLIKIHWSFLRYDMEMMNGAGQTLNVIAVSNRFKSLLKLECLQLPGRAAWRPRNSRAALC